LLARAAQSAWRKLWREKYRSVVARPSHARGRALRLDHEELFDVLGDHIDLLQSLFSGLLTRSQSDAGREAGLADDTSGIAV